jgi:hypothetical protein
MVQQLNQHQLCIRIRIDPQFNGFALLAELDQSGAFRPVSSRAQSKLSSQCGTAGPPFVERVANNVARLAADGNGPEVNRKPKGITMSAIPARIRHPAPESFVVRIRRIIFVSDPDLASRGYGCCLLVMGGLIPSWL